MNPAIGDLFKELEKFITKKDYLLAGGAVRDFLLRKPIKDYDIYIRNTSLNKINAHKIFESDLAKRKAATLSDSDNTDRVCNFAYADKIDCSFIFVDTALRLPEYVQIYFDIGLCKCWFDNRAEKFVVTKEFEHDRNNKVLTAAYQAGVHENSAVGRSILEHIPRILKKYPDFSVRIASKFSGGVLILNREGS